MADRIVALALIWGSLAVIVVAAFCAAVTFIKARGARRDAEYAADFPLFADDNDDAKWAAEFGDTPIFARTTANQAARLRAELDDDAAVSRWLGGGAA